MELGRSSPYKIRAHPWLVMVTITVLPCSFCLSFWLAGCQSEPRGNLNCKHENVGIEFLRIINNYGKPFLIISNSLCFLQSRHKVLLSFLFFQLQFSFSFFFPSNLLGFFRNIFYWNKQRTLLYLNFSYFAIGTRDGFKVFDSETGTLCYERGKFFNTNSYSSFLFVYLVYVHFVLLCFFFLLNRILAFC